MTSVRFGVAPQKKRIGPNSEIARAHVMMAPAMSPFRASGSATRQNACRGEHPRVRATCSRRGLMLSKAAFSARMQNAAATIN